MTECPTSPLMPKKRPLISSLKTLKPLSIPSTSKPLLTPTLLNLLKRPSERKTGPSMMVSRTSSPTSRTLPPKQGSQTRPPSLIISPSGLTNKSPPWFSPCPPSLPHYMNGSRKPKPSIHRKCALQPPEEERETHPSLHPGILPLVTQMPWMLMPSP